MHRHVISHAQKRRKTKRVKNRGSILSDQQICSEQLKSIVKADITRGLYSWAGLNKTLAPFFVDDETTIKRIF
jgi:hypothetical protein